MSFKHKIFDWYPVETPNGGDYITCPRCNNWVKQEDEYLDQIIMEFLYDYNICDKCNLVFNSGCKLCENGCTDSMYYPKVYINKNDIFEFKRSSTIEQINIFNKLINAYKKYCFCVDYCCDMKESYVRNNLNSTYVAYPKNKYPQYYKCYCKEEISCNLLKKILPIDIVGMIINFF